MEEGIIDYYFEAKFLEIIFKYSSPVLLESFKANKTWVVCKTEDLEQAF